MQKIEEMEEDQSYIKCNILGICENKRTCEEHFVLHSGDMFHYRPGQNIKGGGLGIHIHK